MEVECRGGTWGMFREYLVMLASVQLDPRIHEKLGPLDIVQHHTTDFIIFVDRQQ